MWFCVGERFFLKTHHCALRCYEAASLETLPECVSSCWELLRSEAFFLLLSNFTGLRLHFLCPADEDDEKDEEKKKEQDGEATGSSVESPSENASKEKGENCYEFSLATYLYSCGHAFYLQACVCFCFFFKSRAHLCVVVNCVDGPMAPTHCCTMQRQQEPSTL